MSTRKDDPVLTAPGSTNTYLLLAEEKEMLRLDTQHDFMCRIIGGLYPSDAKAAIDATLAPKEDNDSQLTLLDVGSGSGIWTMEMAKMFPHVECVGLDLQPKDFASDLSNLSFVQGDALQRLTEFEGKFDLVHCRAVLLHISNAPLLLDRMVKALRPGGILLTIDPGSARKIVDDPAEKSWTLDWLFGLIEGLTPNPFYGQRTHEWVAARNDLQLGSFQEYWVNCNWLDEEHPEAKELTKYLRSVSYFERSFEACVPALKKLGWPDEKVEAHRQGIREEVKTGFPRLCYTATSTWATKKADS